MLDTGSIVLLAIVILALLGSMGALLLMRRKPSPGTPGHSARPGPTAGPGEPINPPAVPEAPSDSGLPDDLREVVRIIEGNGGRISQIDLRKALPCSEAKVSLMLTDLEGRGIVKKVKKGRGNIIILKRPDNSTE